MAFVQGNSWDIERGETIETVLSLSWNGLNLFQRIKNSFSWSNGWRQGDTNTQCSGDIRNRPRQFQALVFLEAISSACSPT